MLKNFTLKHIFIGALCLQVVACTSGGVDSPPTVLDRSPNRIAPVDSVVVVKGDTLYSIAWRFGLDYQQIAELNGVGKTYEIFPGQRLRLPRSGAKQKTPVRDVPVVVAVTLDSKAPTTEPSVVTATPTPTPTPKVVIAKPAAPKTPSKPAKPAKSKLPTSAPRKWRWPAKGKVIGQFSSSKGQNGIKIAGTRGSAVRSTAAGEVVYAGEGLRGYGKLIIIKHSSAYLSAYAHNHKIMVAEGERIKSGQQIAQMGSSDADRTMLHFEIRKNGKSVDPLKFLK